MPPVTQITFDQIHALKEAQICNDALTRVGGELIRDTDENSKSARILRNLYAQTRDELLLMFPFSFSVKHTLVAEDDAYALPMNKYSLAYKFDDRRSFNCTYDIGATLLEAVDIKLDPRFIGRVIEGADMAEGARIVSYDDTAHTITIDRPTTNIADVTVAVEVETRVPILKIMEIDKDEKTVFELVGGGSERRILTDAVTETDNDGSTLLLELKYIEQVIDPSKFDSMFAQALALRLASKIALEFTKAGGIVQAIQGEFSAIMKAAKDNASQEQQPDESEGWWTDRTGIGGTSRRVIVRG